MRPPKLIRLSDNDKCLDVTDAIQVLKRPQNFTFTTTHVGQHRRVGIEYLEQVAPDHYGNLYVVYRARLPDGDLHVRTYWVGKRIWRNGQLREILLRKFAEFECVNEAFLKFMRGIACASFGLEAAAIYKGMLSAKLYPVAGGES